MPRLSVRAQAKFDEARHRIRGFVNADLLWTEHLTRVEQGRLGGDVEAAVRRYGTADDMWRALHGVPIARAVLDVALALGHMSEADHRWLRRELDDAVDPDEAIESAIARCALVLREDPRAAYWKNEEIEVDWEGQSARWGFLCKLAQAAKAGTSVSNDECGENMTVAKRKHRLKSIAGFPPTLAALILPCGHGEQRLDLPPECVRIFESEPGGGLSEWFPSATRRTAR